MSSDRPATRRGETTGDHRQHTPPSVRRGLHVPGGHYGG